MKKLLYAIIICQLAGLIGSVFTDTGMWYQSLTKPFFQPPNYLFGIVWPILFLLMGVSLYLVWDMRNIRALRLFGLQLVLNILWSALFFGLKQPILALIEIFVLWYFIFLTTKEFYKINKTAGYLLVPYLLWVSFAIVLNLSIVILN